MYLKLIQLEHIQQLLILLQIVKLWMLQVLKLQLIHLLLLNVINVNQVIQQLELQV